MSNFVEDIIFELEFAFLDEPSVKNSIQTSDGEIIRLDKPLWDASPVLRRHFAEGASYIVLTVPQSTVEDLRDAHKHGNLPKDFPNLLNLLAVSGQLELKELTSKCFDALCEIDGSMEQDYPSECSSETVMQCFRVLLRSPLRTADIYKQQIQRIARHCDNNRDVMMNAVNLVKEKLKTFIDMNLQGIPIQFNKRSVPILIYKIAGTLQTAIFDGDQLRSVDLFGNRFDFETVKIEDSFYLKHGSYVLYKSGSSVYLKILYDDHDEPVEILNGCTLFLTRGNYVFAVQDRGSRNIVLQWTNDERFVQIFETVKKIKLMDFDSGEGLLAVKLYSDSVLIFSKSEGKSLVLSQKKDIRYVRNMFVSRKQMYLLTQPSGLFRTSPSWLKTYQILPSTDSTTPEVAVQFSTTQTTLKNAGEDFFLIDYEGVHIVENFPSLDSIRTLPIHGELYAISELALSS